jgi:hypothetical protein
MKNIKASIFVIMSLLGLFFIFSFIQFFHPIIKLKPLDGYLIDAKSEQFSIKGWFSGEYQEKTEKYLNEAFGLRNFYVRLNNQIDFSLFNKAKIAWITVGKNNYLYEINYIKAVCGTDYIGEDSIKTRMEKLKTIQDTFAKNGQTLIWILAAGKGSFYREFIPDEYILKSQNPTNEEIYLKYADSLGINYINFNSWFLANKKKSPYPLYPQYGIHWSYYGACIALDSIIHYIENKRDIVMQHYYWDEIFVGEPNDEDADIAKSLNMLFEPRSFDMGYPTLQLESDSGKTKPSLLVVSDSFYWIMYNHFYINTLFPYNHFWFYNEQSYPEFQPLDSLKLDLYAELKKYDVILIMGTNATIPNLGWGFIEQTWKIYNR